jgi:hypothetical protein
VASHDWSNIINRVLIQMTFIYLLFLLPLYLLPAMVGRSHHNGFAIFVLNVFLGWTFLGWVMALVWACTESKKPLKDQSCIF